VANATQGALSELPNWFPPPILAGSHLTSASSAARPVRQQGPMHSICRVFNIEQTRSAPAA
jgi:hypothetical protein